MIKPIIELFTLYSYLQPDGFIWLIHYNLTFIGFNPLFLFIILHPSKKKTTGTRSCLYLIMYMMT